MRSVAVSATMSPMSTALSASTRARLSGAALLGVGLFFIKIAVIDVLAAARAAAGPVTTYLKATLVAPLFIAAGLLLLVIGAPPEPKPGSLVLRFVTGHGPDSRLKPLGYAVVFVMIGVGFGLYVWVESELQSLGYG